MIRVAIIGASGYTGLESIEILLRHPAILAAISSSTSGYLAKRIHLVRAAKLRSGLKLNGCKKLHGLDVPVVLGSLFLRKRPLV